MSRFYVSRENAWRVDDDCMIAALRTSLSTASMVLMVAGVAGFIIS